MAMPTTTAASMGSTAIAVAAMTTVVHGERVTKPTLSPRGERERRMSVNGRRRTSDADVTRRACRLAGLSRRFAPVAISTFPVGLAGFEPATS